MEERDLWEQCHLPVVMRSKALQRRSRLTCDDEKWEWTKGGTTYLDCWLLVSIANTIDNWCREPKEPLMCAACTTLDHGWKKVIYESSASKSEWETKEMTYLDAPDAHMCRPRSAPVPKCPSDDVLKGCQSLRVARPLMSKCRIAEGLPALLPMPMPWISPMKTRDVPWVEWGWCDVVVVVVVEVEVG
jgi:hypothetical protein